MLTYQALTFTLRQPCCLRATSRARTPTIVCCNRLLQATYALSSPATAVDPNSVSVTSAGTTYRLLTHTYKGYGMGDAFDRSVQQLILVRQLANQRPSCLLIRPMPPVLCDSQHIK